MAEAQQAVSFNPDDASGLIDNVRAIISKVVVDYFTAKSGAKFVNVDVTYKGDTEFIEHYMLGDAAQWAPNASKTGAIPLKEGGRVWNKSDVYRLTKSISDASPAMKKRLTSDLSVLVGLDVQVLRTTTDGTRQTKEGKEVPRTALLVSKVYTPEEAITSGAYAKGGAKTSTGTKAGRATAPAAAPGSPASTATDANDEFVTEVLVEILQKGPAEKTALKQPAFLIVTKAKKSPIRQAVQDRLQDDAFLAGLAEAGLITFDGTTVALAA